MLAGFPDFGAHSLDFLVTPAGARVVVKQAVPVLLGAKARCPPPEENDSVCSMRNCLVGPQSQFPRTGSDAHDLPAT